MIIENIQQILEICNLDSEDKVNWGYISYYQNLSEKFIEKYKDKVNWNSISNCQKLSESFIEKHQEKVYWNWISQYQKLSEKFIEKFQDKVNWNCISSHQKLSEKFIEKHEDKVDWDYISRYQKLSEEFCKKHNLKLMKTISVEDYAKEYNLEIKDGYLYAFRNHDLNGSGLWKNNVYYEKGEYYKDWHCNLNSEHKISYGLGIFPEGNTPVRVKVEDFGTGVKNSDKARVWGFEII